MKNNKGFTVIEILIACSILSMFIIGLLNLYSSGSKIGNSTMWLQSISNQLKNAARQINTSIRKSSYPSCITFPQKIEESESDCFKLHYCDKILIPKDCPTDKKFLVLTESTPGKKGFSTSDNQKAVLQYHVFTLSKNGDLTYLCYKEEVDAKDINSGYQTTVPPNSKPIYQTKLVRDVESIICSKADTEKDSNKQSIQVKINCKMANAKTARSEIAVGTPNVDVIAHSGGW